MHKFISPECNEPINPLIICHVMKDKVNFLNVVRGLNFSFFSSLSCRLHIKSSLVTLLM